MKQTHMARAEAAALRKEEKRRQEKERILAVSLSDLSFLYFHTFWLHFIHFVYLNNVCVH